MGFARAGVVACGEARKKVTSSRGVVALEVQGHRGEDLFLSSFSFFLSKL